MTMRFVDTIPSTNCAEFVCELCGTGYVSAGRPKCTVCPAALKALRRWSKAEKMLEEIRPKWQDEPNAENYQAYRDAQMELSAAMAALHSAADSLPPSAAGAHEKDVDGG